MNFDDKVEKFNYFEKLFFKITLLILGSSIALVLISLAIIVTFSDLPESFLKLIMFVLILTAINFFLSIGRVIKFTIKISGEYGNIGITRSVTGVILNAISFIVLYIWMLVIALSNFTVI